MQNSPRSLTRLLGLFELLAKHAEGLSLAEISVFLGSPKSSLLNLLRPLVAKGYLDHVNNRYTLGATVFQVASNILAARDLSRIVRPALQELAQKSGETVFLVAADLNQRIVTYIAGVDSAQAVRYSVPIGSSRPLHATAAGRLLLAFQNEAWLDNYLKTEKLVSYTKRTPTSPQVLRRILNEVKATGVSISHGDMMEGAGGIAMPILKPSGEVEAGILIAAPIDRFDKALPKLLKVLTETTAKLNGREAMGEKAAEAEAVDSGKTRRRGGSARAGKAGPRQVDALKPHNPHVQRRSALRQSPH